MLLWLQITSLEEIRRGQSPDRKHKDGNAAMAGYKIPRGGAFEWVSGANYFGEIVEWGGFAAAAWSLPTAAFAIFTFCNIGPRAWHHHLWYRKRFDDYPCNRRAVIPFVW